MENIFSGVLNWKNTKDIKLDLNNLLNTTQGNQALPNNCAPSEVETKFFKLDTKYVVYSNIE